MKVVLVNPPIDPQSAWYSLGIGYIASVLRENGFEVEIIDCIGEDLSRAQFIEKVRRTPARAYGIGGIVTAFNSVVDIIRYIREIHPQSYILAGNTLAYSVPHILLRHAPLDLVVNGEGEITTAELLSVVRDDGDIRTVNGITYVNEGGNLESTPARDPITDSDSLPYPHWDLMPLEGHLTLRNAARGARSFD
jgi:anaerobic magnesium-protoporphyrin IX monomethyl ester cyclase